MKVTIRKWTLAASALCVTLLATGCDDREVDGAIGIAYSLADLVYSIWLIAD